MKASKVVSAVFSLLAGLGVAGGVHAAGNDHLPNFGGSWYTSSDAAPAGSIFSSNAATFYDSNGGDNAYIYEYIDGLTAGANYTVSFFAIGSGYSRVEGYGFTPVPPPNTDVCSSPGQCAPLFNTSADTNPSVYDFGFSESTNFLPNSGGPALHSYSFTASSTGNVSLFFKTSTGITISNLNFVTSAVPEPETYAMMLLGLAVLGGLRAKRRG